MSGLLGFDSIASGAFSAPPSTAAAPTEVSGSLAETVDNIGFAASGAITNPVTGTLSQTIDNITVVSSGVVGVSVNVTGTLSTSTENVFVTASGSLGANTAITGFTAYTFSIDSLVSSGSVSTPTNITGAASAPIDGVIAAATGTLGEVTAGNIAATLDDLAISATGINVTAPSGTLSATFSDVVATGAGFSSAGIGLGWELATQKALYDKLKSNAYLASLVTDIYDNPPEETSTYPYVTIGEAVHNEFDTDTDEGNDVTISVHVWSRDRGRKEVKEIQNAIYLALSRQELSVIGYNFINCQFVTSQSFLDSDGKTRHGVQDFQILLDELEEG